MNKKQNNEFLTLLTKLQPEEIYGLARIMCVSFSRGNELKKGEELVFEIIEKFPTLSRPVRRQIIKMLREVKHDVISTENKEEN